MSEIQVAIQHNNQLLSKSSAHLLFWRNNTISIR